MSLFTLVPRISLSIDAMLAKYDKIPSVAKINEEVRGQNSAEEKAQVMKIKQGRGRNFNNNGRFTEKKKICAGCFYLGNKVSANINYKHIPADCPRGPAMVALLEAEEDHDETGKILKISVGQISTNDSHSQVPVIQKESNNFKENPPEIIYENDEKRILLKTDVIESCIFRLNAVVQKASSPALNIKLNNTSGVAIVDEGSELNCIDESFIKKSGCEMIKTEVGAKDAGNSNIAIGGQTKYPVTIKICGENYQASINLGICLVVKPWGRIY